MNACARPRKLPATLYGTRDTAKMLLGDAYLPRMQELGAMLTTVATRRKTSALTAAQDMVRAADLNGFEAIQVLAAAVELTERAA